MKITEKKIEKFVNSLSVKQTKLLLVYLLRYGCYGYLSLGEEDEKENKE